MMITFNKTWLNKCYNCQTTIRYLSTNDYVKLNNHLHGLIEARKPLEEVVNIFASKITVLKSEDKSHFRKNFGMVFDTTLKTLLLESLRKPSDSVSTLSILEKLKNLAVLKPRYFLDTIRYLYNNKDYKLCFEYWVKYSIENPKLDKMDMELHNEIIVLIINSYLLTNKQVSLQFLKKFLDCDNLPLLQVIESLSVNCNEGVMNNLKQLFTEFIKECPHYLEFEIDNIFSAYRLESFYHFYKNLNENDINVDILVATMKRMDSFGQISKNIEIFNDFKTFFKIGSEEYFKFCNQFLISVSKLTNKNKKSAVQAVWNTYYQNRFDPGQIPIFSHCSLLKAIYYTEGVLGLHAYWNNQLIDKLKSNTILTEIYMSLLLADLSNEIDTDKVMKQFQKIETIDLKCSLLLRTVFDPKKTKTDFENFYVTNFQYEIVGNLPKVKAIRLFANYYYTEEKEKFNFFPLSTKLVGQDLRILEELVWIIPDNNLLHKLFNRFKNFGNYYFFELFLKAEFVKENTNLNQVDKIFKTYLTKIKSYSHLTKNRKVLSKFMEIIIGGISKKDYCTDKMEQYLNLALSLKINLNTSTKLKILDRIMDYLRSGFVAEDDKKVLQFLVLTLVKVKWNFSQNDAKMIRKYLGIVVQ